MMIAKTPRHPQWLALLPFCVGAAALCSLHAGQAASSPSPVASDLPEVEDLLPIKELPDPFVLADGKRVTTPDEWLGQRERIKEMLLHYEYGHLPPGPRNLKAAQVSTGIVGNGSMRQERIVLSCGPRDAVVFGLDLLIPPGKTGPFPVILTGDPGATPIADDVVGHGYILAQFDRTVLAPDNASRDTGVYPLYPGFDWGALAAWAWGYHRAVDYLLTRQDVDPAHVVITGHSRGAKAVLLAGALDERIALTAPNESGTGGASPFRLQSKVSESLAKITTRFGYWFHPRLKTFAGHEDQLPFDQHFLMALVAPRALYLNNALADTYGNPIGAQQTYLAAKKVFEFLGAGDRIGSHYREGGHAFNAEDWRGLLAFADWQFFQRATDTKFDGMNSLPPGATGTNVSPLTSDRSP